MSRLIDADALIDFFKEVRMKLVPSNYTSAIEFYTRDNVLLNVIQTLQLEKKIEIVPCKECKYWGDTICERFEEERIMFADDFCSYGEREGE